MELTPRTAPDPSTPTSRSRRSPWAYVVLVAVLVGIGVVAYQGLTSASLYFYNADEAVEQRADLGDKRIRVQGVVQTEAEPLDAGLVAFTIEFNEVPIDVVHDGAPPELFSLGTPVLVEGRWSADDDVFRSDEIIVKHDEQYEAENEDRLEDAEDGRSGDATP